MKKIYTLTLALFLATAGSFAQSVLVHDFEDATIGDEVGSIGWGEQEAEIADDPLATGNNVLKFVPNDYNAAPYLAFTLEAGKTLANYKTFKFQGYFQQGDVGWKDIVVGVSQAVPTGGFVHPDSYSGEEIGTINRASGASTAWESFEIDITNELTLSGTVYIVFGINCDATGDQGSAGAITTWFADDVELVAANATSIPALSPNQLSLYTKDNAIVITDCLGKNIAIYSISGTQVFSQKATSSSITAQLPKGLYIVEMDGVTSKVIVK